MVEDTLVGREEEDLVPPLVQLEHAGQFADHRIDVDLDRYAEDLQGPVGPGETVVPGRLELVPLTQVLLLDGEFIPDVPP